MGRQERPGRLRSWHGAAGLFASEGWATYAAEDVMAETPAAIFAGIPILVDETLPSQHIKLLGGHGKAIVFRIEEDETVTPVAEWDENARVPPEI